jgi:peptide deformylase
MMMFNLHNKFIKINTQILCVFIILLSLPQCTTMKSPLTLKLPKTGLQILQQIPSGDQLRTESPLYLPPRMIKEKEFDTKNLYQVIDSMYFIMQKKAGVGIAANQIGKRLQIFIIEAKADNPRYKVLGPVAKQVFINPRITKVSDNRMNFWHGCLSAEGKDRGNVSTYEWIEYECNDEKGGIRKARLDGFAAVIFQHEFRHLLNGTYLDVAHEFLPKTELDYQISIGKAAFFSNVNNALPLLIGDYKIGESLDDYHSRVNFSKTK